MEQYEISPRICVAVIQKILQHHKPERVCVRSLPHNMSNDTILDEELLDKVLTVKEIGSGLTILINGESKFLFEFADGSLSGEKPAYVWGKRWAIAYERINQNGVMHFACAGYPNSQEPYTGPDDPYLPAVRKTILRSANRNHLIEIIFDGKIPIRKSYPLDKKSEFYYRKSCPLDKKNWIYYWTYDHKSARQ